MAMYLFKNSRFFSSIFLLSLACCSWSVLATPALFSFVGFNLALVLGLSVPLYCLLFFLRGMRKDNCAFSVLMTLTIVLLLYSCAMAIDFPSKAMLSRAGVLITVAVLWPLLTDSMATNNEKSQRFLHIAIGLIIVNTLCFNLILWLLPSIDIRLTWAINIGAVLLLSLAARLYQASCYWLFLPWFLSCLFAVSVLLALVNLIAMNWLVLFAVCCYLAAVVQGNWQVLTRINIIEQDSAGSTPTLTAEEVFSYTHDPTTNLPTQQQALKVFKGKMQQRQTKLAVIAFKPINFHQVNKVLGHHNSDILLLQLAYCLQKKVADNAQLLNLEQGTQVVRLARLQSLHFLVICDLSDTSHEYQIVIDALCKQLALSVPDAMSFKSFSLNFELAFGVAITSEHEDNLEEIFSYATDALLSAEANQDFLEYYDPRSALYTEQHLLAMEQLNQDVLQDKLEWYLQPQINLTNNQVVGFEVMAYWHKEANKEIEFNDFFDVAEHSGDIHLLTKKMIIKACTVLAKLAESDLEQTVAVNLLSHKLLEPDLVDFIEQQIRQFNIRPKSLIIEMTDEIMLSAGDRTQEMIAQLKGLGVGIAIDEFSGSYESLRYLRKMSIDQVKINCQLLKRNEESRAGKAIVNALINLVRAMQLPLVGVAVDSTTIGDIFVRMEGEVAQGKMICHGIAFDKFDTWLHEWFRQHPQPQITEK